MKSRISTRTLGLLGLKLVITVSLVVFVLQRVPLAEVWSRLRSTDLRVLCAALPLYALQVAVLAWRWQLLARGLMGYGAALRYTWIGIFYGAVLPGGVSGDVAKGAALAAKDRDVRAAQLPVSILMDRLVGFWVLLVLAAIGCALLGRAGASGSEVLRSIYQLSAVGCCLGVAGGLFACTGFGRRLLQAIGRKIPAGKLDETRNRLLAALEKSSSDRGLLARSAALSLVTHGLSVVLYLISLHAVGQSLPVLSAITFYAVNSVLVMVPLTVSGIGLRDWFAVLFFESLALPADAAVAFTWVSLACGLLFAGIGGLVQLYELFRPGRDTKANG